MSNLWKKKGVWLFLATAVLYFAGQTYLGIRLTRIPVIADDLQSFDAKGIHTVRIERSDLSRNELSQYRQLVVKFLEPTTEVRATYGAGVYELKARVEGDVLVLAFTVPDAGPEPKRKPRSLGNGGEQILLPPSIGRLEFVNAGRYRILSETMDPLGVLEVQMADCLGSVHIDKLDADKVTLAKRCQHQRSANNYDERTNIGMSQVKIGSLEITATDGSISLMDQANVGALTLHVSDDVTVNASAALLRATRFGPAPE